MNDIAKAPSAGAVDASSSSTRSIGDQASGRMPPFRDPVDEPVVIGQGARGLPTGG